MLNIIDEEIYFTISDSILKKNFKNAFEVSQKIYENGWNFIDFLNGLNEHFRNIMTVVIRKNGDLIEAAEIYKSKYLNMQINSPKATCCGFFRLSIKPSMK